ncbi:MAG: multiubiquitin domain-containing protein [Gemmatimonadota bacterium]
MSEENKQRGGEETVVAELKKEVTELKEEVEILEEIIDLEEWSKADKQPRRAKRYRIRIDKDYIVVEVHSMTGREILALVGKTPETHLLSQKFRGGRVEPIKSDQVVEFHRHQIERFQTLALDPTEG